jgi:MOSC domain-containing protein YiiM
MKIISTNIAKPVTIQLNGKQVTTGIYKKPVNQPIYLEKEQVRGDEISNRKVHGGEFKACYLFSADYYPYWKNLYPHLEWNWGMLGENLTVKGLDESKLFIGNIYKVGTALIQVTQPREPCNTFAAKMGSKDILKQFIAHSHPGTYVRVLEEGFVTKNDTIILVEQAKNSLTIAQFFNLLFTKEKNQSFLTLAINNEALPLQKRMKLATFLKQKQ